MPEIKALLFDVFGTVVDWRTSVREYLVARVPDGVRTDVDWDRFADDWRNAYYKFTFSNSASSDTAPFTTIDQQYRLSLDPLVEEHGISGVWTAEQLDDIALAWHFLKGWPDSVEGLELLKSRYIIGTLSNGNVRLLVDMAKFAGLPWDIVFGGDIFKIYKPSPKVYLGAAEHLQLAPENVLMVAAHIYDLKAAKSCGLQTAYIPRPGEDTGIEVTPDEVDYYAADFVELFKQLTNK